MKMIKWVAILAALIVALFVAISSIYTVSEVEQAIVTQFGKPVGDPVTSAGLKLKVPSFRTSTCSTSGFLSGTAIRRYAQPRTSFNALGRPVRALEDVDPSSTSCACTMNAVPSPAWTTFLGSETRNTVAKHELIEIIRTTKDRVPLRDTRLIDPGRPLDVGSLVPLQKGRKLVEQEIFAEAPRRFECSGIELLDIPVQAINSNESVRTEDLIEWLVRIASKSRTFPVRRQRRRRPHRG